MLAATCGKIGREIYTLMKTEFGEVEEPVPPGTVGSSTMPQKRNPKLCQDIIAAGAEIRSCVPLALEAMQTEHEADRTTSVMMDAAEARACIATGDMLSRLVEVLRGLRLDPQRMRHNLDLGGGLIMAEAVMLSLGQTIGRQHAHDVVYDAAQAAFVEGKSFGMLLAADRRVTAHLSPQQIGALLDPAGYTGLCAEMARDAAARARTVAGELSDDRVKAAGHFKYRQDKPGPDNVQNWFQPNSRSPCSSMICLALAIENAIASSRLEWVSARTKRCSFTSPPTSFSMAPAV
jgi:adenylosuccinate lyase